MRIERRANDRTLTSKAVLSMIERCHTSKQEAAMQSRHDEIQAIHHQYALFYRILGSSVLVLMGILIGSWLFALDGPLYSEDGYRTNLYTEFIGMGITVLIIDFLNNRREREHEKRMLIAQLGSLSNEASQDAARILWTRRWLTDGSMRGAKLTLADLTYADMGASDLRDVTFVGASLMRARLWASKLQGANFEGADLEGAWLMHPLYGTAKFDAHTRLPDGSFYNPEKGLEQFDRFLNRDHPQFWRSKNPHLPSYAGDEPIYWRWRWRDQIHIVPGQIEYWTAEDPNTLHRIQTGAIR
jgi:hypothetical protein